MEARQTLLTEQRARVERRRGYLIAGLTMVFAIAARVLMF